MADLTEKLEAEIFEVPWQHLAQHAARDGVIIVAHALDLLTVAMAVAQDDSVQVGAWMESGGLRKPTADELDTLEKERATLFRTVICAPWVLAQELGGEPGSS
jgi:hypothetical protein